MTKTMKIEGMMCGHCEARVKKTLEAIEGVQEAAVSPRGRYGGGDPVLRTWTTRWLKKSSGGSGLPGNGNRRMIRI